MSDVLCGKKTYEDVPRSMTPMSWLSHLLTLPSLLPSFQTINNIPPLHFFSAIVMIQNSTTSLKKARMAIKYLKNRIINALKLFMNRLNLQYDFYRKPK